MRNDPYATGYTDEELQQLPQTTQVFDAPQLKINDHKWLQQGYMIEDACDPPRPDCQRVGIPIPTGSLLIKDKGGYRLVDEVTRK